MPNLLRRPHGKATHRSSLHIAHASEDPPGFSAVVVFTLALGIGANSTIFSVVNSLLFAPIPYKNADRLVRLFPFNRRLNLDGAASIPNFVDWQKHNQVFEQMAAYHFEQLNYSGGGEPERLVGYRVSQDFFSVVGVAPVLGRAFLPEEYGAGDNRVALLSHGFWQRRFGGRPDTVGQSVTLNGNPYLVAGVLPDTFKVNRYLEVSNHLQISEPELWLPLALNDTNRGNQFLVTIALMKPGVIAARANVDMATIFSRLEQQYPDTNKGWEVLVLNMYDRNGGEGIIISAVLMTTVGFVLLISCANVTNLLLARSLSRKREVAIRTALGASRGRLVRQMLTESLFLSLLGGLTGLVVAFWTCDFIRAASVNSIMSGARDVRVDFHVLGFTLLVSSLTGLIVGLAPAMQVSRTNVSLSLKEGTEGSQAGSPKRRLRSFLVISEVMLSLILLICTGLMIKSRSNVWRIDPGFRAESVLTMEIALTQAQYPKGSQQTAYSEQMLTRVTGLPGVLLAGVASALPMTGFGAEAAFNVMGRPKPAPGEQPVARFSSASPGYFHAMGITLKVGRFFEDYDNERSLPVALINENIARKYWERRNPVGMQIEVGGTVRTVVGVLGDIRNIHLVFEPTPEIFVPFAQSPQSNMMLALRTLAHPLDYAAVVKRKIRALDAGQPSAILYKVKPTDPFVFMCIPLLLLMVAFLACYVPARQATRVDPMAALRYE